MKYRIETITPDAARVLLKQNTHNRIVRQRWVDTLATEMANGRWSLTHQGIAIAKDGELLDGQHRLLAIAQSGVTVEMWVARDADMGVQPLVDGGSKRNVADFLHMNDGVVSANVKSAAIRQIVSFCCFYQGTQVSYGFAKTIYDDMGRELDFVHESVAKFKPALRGWCIGILAFAYNAERGLADFITGIGSGENLKGGDPAKAVREWLINSPRLGATYKRGAVEGLLNAAYNAHLNQKINTIRKGVQGADYFLGKKRRFVSTVREQMRHQIEGGAVLHQPQEEAEMSAAAK